MEAAQPAPQPAQPAQQVTVNTGAGAALDAGGAILTRVSGFTPQQAVTVITVLVTLFVCATVAYLIYAGQRNQAETLAIIIRSMEGEAEKNRAANAVEFEKNRAALTDGVRLTTQSHAKLSQELGKLEQVVSNLNSAIAELRRKLPPTD